MRFILIEKRVYNYISLFKSIQGFQEKSTQPFFSKIPTKISIKGDTFF